MARTRVAIYAGVSTDGQSVDGQVAELQRVAERHVKAYDCDPYSVRNGSDVTRF